MGPAVKIATTIIEAVDLAAKGASRLSRNANNLRSAIDKENSRIEEQIRELRRAKNLIGPVDEQEQTTRSLLDEQIRKLEGFQRIRKGLLDDIPQVENRIKNQVITGGEAVDLDVRTEFETLFRQIANTDENIDNLKIRIIKLREALEEPARNSDITKAFDELCDCIRQLCGRLDTRGQQASFDRASTRPGDARLIPASFTGASPFGGAGLDGLNRELADARGPLDDLSAGFVKLTQAAGGFETQGGSLVAFLTRSNALLGEQSGLLGELVARVPELGGQFSTLLDAFKGAAFEGKSLREVLLKIIQDMLVLSQASLGGGSGGRTTEGDSFGSALTKKHEVKNKKDENDPQVPELQTDLRRSSAAQTNVGLGFRRFAAIPTNLGRNRGSFAPHVQRPPKFCARTTIPISNTAPSMPSKASNKPWNSSRLQWTQREAIGLTASRQYLQGIVAISHLHLDSTTGGIAHA